MTINFKEVICDKLNEVQHRAENADHLDPASFAKGYNAGVRCVLKEILLHIEAQEMLNEYEDKKNI